MPRLKRPRVYANPKATVTPSYGGSDAPVPPAPEEDTEFANALNRATQDAIDYVDTTLSPDRATATDYYKGRKFGNEQEGRSQFVIPEVRNAIRGAIPDLVEVIFGPDYPVLFVPDRPEASVHAEIATETCHTIFTEQNNGFLETLSVWKDGFLKKLGAFKYWWDEATKTTGGTASGLNEMQVKILADDPEITLTSVEPAGMLPIPGPTGEDGVMLFDVAFTRKTRQGQVRIKAIPPEELLFSPEARSVDDALFLGHRREITVADLMAMGYDRKDIEPYVGLSTLRDNPEEVARQPNAQLASMAPIEMGADNRKCLYIEGSLRWNGALYQTCTIGEGYHVLRKTLIARRDMAVFCPDPEPHALLGDSLYDTVGPFQLLKSMVVRTMLDSAAGSVYETIAYDENRVPVVEEILDTSIGRAIRTQGPPGEVLMPFSRDFKGRELLGVSQFVDAELERTTGQPKGVITLDMDALQSTEKAAAQAAMRAGKAQSMLYLRIFCEGTLKPLFRGILTLLIEHQDAVKPLYSRGRWLTIDPRSWNADWNVSTKVAIGAGYQEERMAMLTGIAAKQEQAIQMGGPDNALTDMTRYRNTLAELTKLGGYPDVDRFWKSPEEIAQATEAMANAPPPPPSPELLIAQNEIQKTQLAAEQKEAELTLKAQEADRAAASEAADREMKLQIEEAKTQAELVIAREKIASTERLAMAEMSLKYEAQAADRSAAQEPRTEVILPEAVADPLRAMAAQTEAMMTHASQQLQQTAADTAQLIANLLQQTAASTQALQQTAVAMVGAMQKLAPPPPPAPRKRRFRMQKDADGQMRVDEE